MIRALLIDDEISALKAMSKKLEMYCSNIEVIAECSSAKEGLAQINALNPDLVFLDIEMPWMNGFELLECLGGKVNFLVVFVTAYDQYAIQAFKVQALDYLLKPVDKDDLIECIEKIKTKEKNFEQKDLQSLLQDLDKPTNSNRFMVHSADGIEVLTMEEIVYCQASSNYTYIYTTDERKIVVSKTLSEIEKKLKPDGFLRVHKSYTANLNYVKRFSNLDGGELILKGGVSLPVSRRKKEDVLNAITNLS